MAGKSLGTLTLDLVAKVGGFEAGMDKAGRKTKSTSREIEKHIKSISKTIAGLGVAAAGGLVAMTTHLAESAREIENLSKLADATPQTFQRITYAAQRYGIEQEKVADILKDTNDKIGDFIQTGGGPLADFFENIAPMVGVTADEFARLSGPDALQLYVSSLEKAGVSQKDMTFYMEALASDSTKLLPLLRDNGKEMKALGIEAENTGNVFSDLEFEQLAEVTKSMDQLKASFSGMSNEVVMAALPAINDLIDFLSDPETIDAAKSLGGAIVTSVTVAVKAIRGAVEMTQHLAEELAVFVNGISLDDIPRLKEALDEQAELVDKLEKQSKRDTGDSRFFVPKKQLEEERKELERLQEQYQRAVELKKQSENIPEIPSTNIPEITGSTGGDGNNGGNSGSLKGTSDDADDAAESMRELEKALADMRAELDPAMASFDQYADQIELIDEFNISAAEKEQLRLKAYQDYQDRMTEIAKEGEEQRGEITNEVSQSYWDQYLEAVEVNAKDFDDLTSNMLENLTSGVGDAFESMIFEAESFGDAVYAVADGISRSLVNALGQVAAQLLVNEAIQATIGEQGSAAAVVQAETTGSAIASAYAPAAAAASLASFGSNATAAIAGIAATTAAAYGLTGMAHEGLDSVPQTGTWLLEKGERVTTAQTSAKLDNTLNRVQQNMSSGGSGSSIEDRIRIVNIESNDGVENFWGSTRGEKLFVNHLARNKRTLKALVNQ
ncbi:hypothetical protein [Marinobacter sp. NFXS9]|uniref:hypothetical protein n=1 Tax=Marinobacter sp. NFXS9 TaxID=2818433 RepID=UPI0032DFA373